MDAMATLPSNPLTAEEFWEWLCRPECEDRLFELVRGRIVEMPLRGELHGFVCANVSHLLTSHVWQRGRGYVCCNNPGVIVARNPDTVRCPDVILFDGMPEGGKVSDTFADRPPTLAVEVLSEEDTAGQLLGRIGDLLRFGTRLVWVVDPESRSVFAYRAGGSYSILESDMELIGGDVLPDFRCRVSEFFALPGQTS
jgi:Uma2 family endonuclease